MINPSNIPECTLKILKEKPELAIVFGYELNAKLCKFKPKYKAGDITKVLIMSNEDETTPSGFVPRELPINDPEDITEKTEIFYAEVEITGYYEQGYGCIIKQILYKRNDDSEFDEVGHHHTYHTAWFEKANNKEFIEAIFELQEKVSFD
jgi:hypothetical protein